MEQYALFEPILTEAKSGLYIYHEKVLDLSQAAEPHFIAKNENDHSFVRYQSLCRLFSNTALELKLIFTCPECNLFGCF